jgi:hypothetical protein
MNLMRRCHRVFACALVCLAAIATGPRGAVADENDPLAVPHTCGRDATGRADFQWAFSAMPWGAHISVEHEKGMVLRNIVLSDTQVANRPFISGVRVPHFILLFRATPTGPLLARPVQFCAEQDKFGPPQASPDGRRVIWRFEKRVDERFLKGFLTVIYTYTFGGREPRCVGRRPSDGLVFTRACYRFVPRVDYAWTPVHDSGGEPVGHLEGVTAFFRFDYGHVGIALVSDGNHIVSAIAGSGLAPILGHERRFVAVNSGAAGEFDNIHTVYPVDGRRAVVVPGCRWFGFDCVHMHWRWGGQSVPGLDPLVEPDSGGRVPGAEPGEVYLAPGQTIEIGIVADRGEGDVREPLLLADGDRIAETEACYSVGGGEWISSQVRLKSVLQPVTIWYRATAPGPRNSFMRHGFFALEPLGQSSFSEPGTVLDNVYESRRSVCDPMITGTAVTKRKGVVR